MSDVLDKQRQKHLLRWLKSQTKWAKKWYFLSLITGILAALLIIAQSFILALLLDKVIMQQASLSTLRFWLIGLIALFGLRALLLSWRERIHFQLGATIRQHLRKTVLDHLSAQGTKAQQGHHSGAISTLILEQIENMHDFYAKYLPQTRLSMIAPIFILLVLLPFNWAAAAILFCTAPLIPLFMILVGMGAADANRKNFKALSHLSGYFLDRVRAIKTLKLFNAGARETQKIESASTQFRQKTMIVLRMAFLSSAVLEFFTSISIAIVAVYFGFSYLGELDFGHYGFGVSLFVGFFALILAPEFYLPLRELGTFYHAKAQAIAAGDELDQFLKASSQTSDLKSASIAAIPFDEPIKTIAAKNLILLSPDHQNIAGAFSFLWTAPFDIALTGESGVGKTAFFNVLMGFLPYSGSLKINDKELRDLDITQWRAQLSWVKQPPYLFNASIAENLHLASPNAPDEALYLALEKVQLKHWVQQLPQQLNTPVGEDSFQLSVGQAQRLTLARALLKPHQLLLLDEATASLDAKTQREIEALLARLQEQNKITITHQTQQCRAALQYQMQSHQLILIDHEANHV